MQFLCPKETAAILGVSERGARRLMANNQIQSFRVGRKPLRTTMRWIIEYAERQCEPYRRPVHLAAQVVSITDLRAA